MCLYFCMRRPSGEVFGWSRNAGQKVFNDYLMVEKGTYRRIISCPLPLPKKEYFHDPKLGVQSYPEHNYSVLELYGYKPPLVLLQVLKQKPWFATRWTNYGISKTKLVESINLDVTKMPVMTKTFPTTPVHDMCTFLTRKVTAPASWYSNDSLAVTSNSLSCALKTL